MFTSDAVVDRVMREAQARLRGTSLLLCLHGVHTAQCSCASEALSTHRNAISASVAFLITCDRTRAAGCDSYGLKHRVERWTHHIGMDTYVPQGALVTAAIGMGFAYKQRPPYASQRVMLGVGRKHGMMGIIVR